MHSLSSIGASTKPALSDLFPEEIASTLGLKPFQGGQVFRWIHQKKVFDFEAMTDLSKSLRETLRSEYRASRLALVSSSTSEKAEGTRKVLMALPDGETVESVLIREDDRTTLCLSSQVGCAVKCAFCATGLSGYQRNLSPGEIVEQALHLLRDEELGERTPNIVYMGMGEPFRNYDAVAKSIQLLMRKEGLHIGARKITVSTAGEVPGISRFAREDWQVRLSISLHAANDELRSKLVPLNRKYPISQLMAAVREYISLTGRHLTFEWTLLNGVNDSPGAMDELTRLVQGLNVTVNLIPYNPVAGVAFQPPPRERCEMLRDRLLQRGINATLRKEKGQDINAACGQLRRQVLACEG